MPATRTISTSAGSVEILHVPGSRPPVLFFAGGHCSAVVDCGRSAYSEAGHEVIAFSRPGYGATRVGALTAAEFAPLVGEVCAEIGVTDIAAAVGVSFGGLQAVHTVTDSGLGIRRLVLHSCAPSALPFPDTRATAIGGRLAFSPLAQGAVWGLVHRMVRSDSGLRRMLSPLSRLPIAEWWPQLSAADRTTARELFRMMRSDRGFVTDVRQGRAADAEARRAVLARVHCATLVTGSRHDGGVSFAHAESFAATIPDAALVELDSPSHLFWIGQGRDRLASIIADFLDGPR